MYTVLPLKRYLNDFTLSTFKTDYSIENNEKNVCIIIIFIIYKFN